MTVNKNEADRLLPQRFIFNESNQQVRTVVIDNQPYFVAKDICDILGHTNASVAIQMLDDDERVKESLGRQGATWVVNESGLYNLIFRSNKAGAKSFRRWVTGEVLPAIRKDGCYAINSSRYVPLHEYREQVRLAEFERREAETWYRRSQAYLSLLEKSAENQAKMSQAMLSLSQASAVSVPAAPQSSEWMTVVGYASLHNIPCSLSMAGQLGRKAASLCAKQGITPDTIPDPRFGRVNTYPVEILKRVFEQAK